MNGRLLVGLFRIHFFAFNGFNWVANFALRLHLELFLFFLLFREFFLAFFEAVIRSCQGILSGKGQCQLNAELCSDFNSLF
jgi:hypothetical protein